MGSYDENKGNFFGVDLKSNKFRISSASAHPRNFPEMMFQKNRWAEGLISRSSRKKPETLFSGGKGALAPIYGSTSPKRGRESLSPLKNYKSCVINMIANSLEFASINSNPPQFATMCHNSPQSPAIPRNSTQFTAIQSNLLLNYPKFCGVAIFMYHHLVTQYLLLLPPPPPPLSTTTLQKKHKDNAVYLPPLSPQPPPLPTTTTTTTRTATMAQVTAAVAVAVAAAVGKAVVVVAAVAAATAAEAVQKLFSCPPPEC